MSTPTVSVILAVYNGQEFLAESIRSVLEQPYNDFEFIIINDCSTDSTLEIIESFRDPRIFVFTNEKNLGQASSLNIGIERARGRYLARIDADDLFLPGKLEKQVAYLESHPDVAVLGTGAVVLDDAGQVRGVMGAMLEPWEIEFRMFFESPMIHVSVMMKRDIILSLGGYNPQYTIAADYHLWSRLLMEGKRLANIPDILTAYRVMETTYGVTVGRMTLKDEIPKITQRYLTEHINWPTTFEDAIKIHQFIRAPEDMDRRTFKDTQRLFLEIADYYAKTRGMNPERTRAIVSRLFAKRRILKFLKRNRIVRPVWRLIRTTVKVIVRAYEKFIARKYKKLLIY